MDLKVKKLNDDGIVRLETKAPIREVIISTDILKPSKETIAICFAGKKSSGIMEISLKEFEKLEKAVKDKLHLIKGVKKLYSSGAIKL